MMAYIPLDSSVTKTSGDVYNIDPFITYVNPKNGDKHNLRTRYMRVINDNDTKDDLMVRTMSPKPIILNINIKKV